MVYLVTTAVIVATSASAFAVSQVAKSPVPPAPFTLSLKLLSI